MLDRLDPRTKNIIEISKSEASSFHTRLIEPEHLLLSIIREDECSASMVLKKYKVNISNIKRVIRDMKLIKIKSGDVRFSDRSKKIIDHSLELIIKNGHDRITPEHLLFAMLSFTNNAKNIINKISNCENIKEQIGKIIFFRDSKRKESEKNGDFEHAHTVPSGPNYLKRSLALEAFGKNLTQMAKNNILDPVIGRTEEIGRVINILTRRKKNNPVLVGNAGVGKTAVVEAIASAIAKDNVPSQLKNKQIYSIDLGLMVAGTKYRGQFEERIKALIKEASENKDIIIFLDEIHTIVGAGSAEGTLDAANILKPALSRGEIKCIGATTMNEYRRFIEKDAALERRFHPIFVQETTIEETFTILKELQSKYEKHHGISITDEAIYLCCKLSKKYIQDRYLPDKAIDIIDEAAAYVSLGKTDNIISVKKEIKEIEKQRDKLLKEGKFEELKTIHNKLKELNEKLFSKTLTRTEFATVTPETIRLIISEISKVPLNNIQDDEKINLDKMEEYLKKIVINQEEAINKISKVVKKNRVGLSDPKRPIGSFFFVGPTGVGKTWIAKQLAKLMFGNEEALIQVNMSEYMEKHSISKIIGSPPGYVGYEDAGQLTEAIRRRPYSVLLLDEIEKAHPELLHILLQVFEEGELKDSSGRKTSFKNCIIIMTSNIGVEKTIEKQVGFNQNNKTRNKVSEIKTEIKNTFKPEFLNRLDDIVVFNKLIKDDVQKIVELEIKPLEQKLEEKNITLHVDKKTIDHITDKVNPDEYGARPVKRAIATMLEDKITDMIIKNEIEEKSDVYVSIKNKEIDITSEKK